MSLTMDSAVTAVATRLATVTNLGRVHTYRRTLKDLPTVNAVLFDATQQKIAGAFISIEGLGPSAGEIGRPLGAGVGVLAGLEVLIEIFRGVEDAAQSELVFRTVVEAVVRAVNAGRVVSVSSGQTAPRATLAFIMLASQVLAHYGQVRFTINGRLTA